MVVSCEDVWCEISNYLDGEVEPGLRAAMEEHFLGCKRCTAVLDGTRNVIRLFGDERLFEVPLGFSRPRLRTEQARPAASIPPDLMVIVAEHGKTFHVTGCPFIHDKSRLRTI